MPLADNSYIVSCIWASNPWNALNCWCANPRGAAPAGRKPDGRREERLLKATLARSALERQLSQPQFASSIK